MTCDRKYSTSSLVGNRKSYKGIIGFIHQMKYLQISNEWEMNTPLQPYTSDKNEHDIHVFANSPKIIIVITSLYMFRKDYQCLALSPCKVFIVCTL